MRHHSIFCRRVRATAILLLLISASAVSAQDVPFAFLIEDGWQSFTGGGAFRAQQNLASWYGRGQIHAIVNAQKGPQIGTAHFVAFSRAVPDPTFDPIGPLAGLIVLNFGAFRGHLTVIETPTGLKSTIAILDQSDNVDFRVSGAWVFGPGAAVIGGTTDDMVVGGVVHFGSPLPASNLSLTMSPYFPLVPFSNDLPFHVFSSSTPLGWPVGTGSSYHNSASGALRTYMRSDVGGFFDDFTGTVTVLHTGADNYVVLSCGWYFPISELSPSSPVRGCTVSGVGAVLSRLTGAATSYAALTLQQYVMQWQMFIAP